MELNLLLSTKCQVGCHLFPCQPSMLTVFSSFALPKFTADTHLLFEPEELTLILWKSTPNLLSTSPALPCHFPFSHCSHTPIPPNPFIYHHLLHFLSQSLYAQRGKKKKSVINVPSRKSRDQGEPQPFLITHHCFSWICHLLCISRPWLPVLGALPWTPKLHQNRNLG